jgi:hypothetical protein
MRYFWLRCRCWLHISFPDHRPNRRHTKWWRAWPNRLEDVLAPWKDSIFLRDQTIQQRLGVLLPTTLPVKGIVCYTTVTIVSTLHGLLGREIFLLPGMTQPSYGIRPSINIRETLLPLPHRE